MGMLNPTLIGDASSFYPTNYLSEEQDSKKSTSRKGFDLEKWYRYNQYKFDFKLLERSTGITLGRASSYVDIGCGSGERVTFVSEQGCKEAYGVDKFDFAKIKSKAEASIINSDILEYKPAKKIEITSLFHVLEHLENPHQILTHLQKHVVKKDGHLIVQIPNYHSFERHIFREKWYGLDVPRHLWQYNEKSIRKLLEDSGFKVNSVFQLGAPLHPVTLVPSMFKELDVQRIWVNRSHGDSYKKLMMLLWAFLTVLTIPLALVQNLFKRSSMLTVVASKK
ncbi:class I SAM-dependent methyltransferase [Candidatus Nomurabacteria bacterium]|nr:class I SAM-dependent methyltransferase [Candidatus Nomurabacteria bacterium]